MDNLLPILHSFDPISLDQMDDVKLLDRSDTKFLLPEASFQHVLQQLLDGYRILEIDGERCHQYRSLYFDTNTFTHFRDHHNGRTFRSKVRYREYTASGLRFLEVKRRTGRGATKKKRIAVERITGHLGEEHRLFVAQASKRTLDLVPILWNCYTRFTFVHRERPERLTIDRDLSFTTPDSTCSMNGVCIAELKQPCIDRRSPFTAIMHDMGLRPGGLSKYCLGVVLSRPDVKHNAFNEALRAIDRARSHH